MPRRPGRGVRPSLRRASTGTAPTGSPNSRSMVARLVTAEEPDPVARPEEREVGGHDVIEQAEEVGFDPQLHGRLASLRVAPVERAAAEHHT